MENRIEKALELLTKKPYLVTMGANTVARRYGYSRQEITEAKKSSEKRTSDSYIRHRNFSYEGLCVEEMEGKYIS